jgi:magnesium-transporting ATPase (P-type)
LYFMFTLFLSLQAVSEQFRRFANLYFLLAGVIMAVGTYTPFFESAISPWTTLGPLAVVISFSLLVEGSADAKRHRSDKETNYAPCVILRRSDELTTEEGEEIERDPHIMGGKDVVVNLSKYYHQTSNSRNPETPAQSSGENVSVAFQKLPRMNIRQGHLILVKNREMVPADMILLASSGDGGSSYIETSSIDGETNLKLRTSPHLPKKVLRHLRGAPAMETFDEELDEVEGKQIETLEQAAKRITRFSALAYPEGISALENPNYVASGEGEQAQKIPSTANRSLLSSKMTAGLTSVRGMAADYMSSPDSRRTNLAGTADVNHYIAALTSEPPNPHVNTFSGKITLPPVEPDGGCFDIPLGADNILLRGAVVRNTEWVIGLACFTGTDTKLVQNSFDTPSKFSQLDVLMNYTVAGVIVIMVFCISYLATQAVNSNFESFDDLWYVGLNTDEDAKWPYLPNLATPKWEAETPNWLQMFFLYVTLLSNFVPLSMYVTVEAINFFFLWLIYVDQEMYDDTTNTRGLARSTNLTDLGQVQYIFSDKTGTLTQNVMRFKRCSVDGMIFGTPIQKARETSPVEDDGNTASSFHPLRQLLVGRVEVNPDGKGKAPVALADGNLTFNAEMFLRVLSLCHTVVVEKDLDLKENIDSGKSVDSSHSKAKKKKLFGGGNRSRTTSDMSTGSNLPTMGAILEETTMVEVGGGPLRNRAASAGSQISIGRSMEKSKDGAPLGFAYQAESPDEGALVSAASKSFGFQVVGRDSSGIRLRCAYPTIFSDQDIVAGLRSGDLAPKNLASETAAGLEPVSGPATRAVGMITDPNVQRIETWSILAVNKFDSDRKRMSILLRAPPEFGSFTVLFCKGADSAMLDPTVCTGATSLMSGRPSDDADISAPARLGRVSEDREERHAEQCDEWEMAQMLGIQSHLGDFASEGLRTLVLGIRFLDESECESWLEMYNSAATSIKNRSELLTAAAMAIEHDLHIVGATAIEDKLQVGVPKTIATLAKAGIKLWVLTGDKRETAIEIGYSTHVLTPKMHLTEVADRGAEYVRAQCAMEFMRLVKAGKLPQYQRAYVDQKQDGLSWENLLFGLGKCQRSLSRCYRGMTVAIKIMFLKLLCFDLSTLEAESKGIKDEEKKEKTKLRDVEQKRLVRNRAEKLIEDFLNSPEGQKTRRQKQPMSPVSEADSGADATLTSDELPAVFNRAQSAKTLLQKTKSAGGLAANDMRSLSIASLTAQEMNEEPPLIDEDALSLNSFFPGDKDATSNFDRKRRTILERLFAVDRDVRKGKLVKHLKKEKRIQALASPQTHMAVAPAPTSSGEGPRALVIEGAALKHLLGDPELENLIFSIASGCDAVIACRVSPRQKALLVNLVRHHVVPEPVTLAIGDGANDVGMIQEAHIGVGVSGKEGKQAVNASDFAIAQFRFLEELVLIHGRWNFFRMSTVVLFSFYKNAVMAGCLIVYNNQTIYSGTPLFDDWVIAMLNFVCGFPILFLGMFDRCLEKEYIKSHPEVYKPTRDNELITFRVALRWVILVFAHVFIIYYTTVPQMTLGGGTTAAFKGLASNIPRNQPGEGEGGDLLSVGAVGYTNLVLVLGLKVSCIACKLEVTSLRFSPISLHLDPL